MGKKNMLSKEKRPEIIVFAGPNGSGKSTVTKMAKIIESYINADDIKAVYNMMIWQLLKWQLKLSYIM